MDPVIDSAVRGLVENRSRLSSGQVWSIIWRVLPAKVLWSSVVGICGLIYGAFSLGWESHQFFNDRDPIKKISQDSRLATSDAMLSPEETVARYLALLSNGDYQQAWKMLSRRNFRDYGSYTNWWEKVEAVSAREVIILDENTYSARVRVKLEYRMKSKRTVMEKPIIFHLTRTEKSGLWQILSTEREK